MQNNPSNRNTCIFTAELSLSLNKTILYQSGYSLLKGCILKSLMNLGTELLYSVNGFSFTEQVLPNVIVM